TRGAEEPRPGSLPRRSSTGAGRWAGPRPGRRRRRPPKQKREWRPRTRRRVRRACASARPCTRPRPCGAGRRRPPRIPRRPLPPRPRRLLRNRPPRPRESPSPPRPSLLLRRGRSRRRAETVFERISEAYDTLRSEERRREYFGMLSDERVRGDRRRAQMVSQSDAQFKLAEELLSQGEIERAEEYLRRAIDLFHDDA